MNPKSRPRFDPEEFAFFRKENAGYASAISPADPSKALRIFNPTVLEIGQMCTGEHTLEEIRAQYLEMYQQPPGSPLVQWVDESIYALAMYNLVTFELDEEPRSAGPPMPKVRRLEEWDLDALRLLLGGGEFPQKIEVPTIYYRHPDLTHQMYGELLLRVRIFQQRELFFAVTEGERIDFVISFLDERPIKPVGSLAIVAGTDTYTLEQGLAYVFPAIERDLPRAIHKLVWRHVTGGHDISRLTVALAGHGFVHEATHHDEYGPGRDELVHARVIGERDPQESP